MSGIGKKVREVVAEPVVEPGKPIHPPQQAPGEKEITVPAGKPERPLKGRARKPVRV